MITWNETRAATAAETFSRESSSFSSATFTTTAPGGLFTNQTWATSFGLTEVSSNFIFHRTETSVSSSSYENDVGTASESFSYSERGATSWDAYTFSSSSTYTYHADGDGGPVTTSSSSSAFEGDAITPGATSFMVSTETTQGRTFTTVSEVQKETTHTISTVHNGRASYTTNVGTISYLTTANMLDEPLTSSTTLTVLAVSTSDTTFSGPVELGTVFATNDAQEWIWIATFAPDAALSSQTAGTFITAPAASFTRETFWPTVSSSAVPLLGVNATDDPLTFSRTPHAEETVTYASTSFDGIKTVTTTAGDFFSRNTTTTTANSVVSYTTTEGFTTDAGTFLAFTTKQDVPFGGAPVTALAPVLSNVDGVNDSRIIGTTSYAQFGTTALSIEMTDTFVSMETFDGGYQQDGRSESVTYNVAPLLATIADSTELNRECVSRPFSRGLRVPWDIDQEDAIGSNLDATPRIYYPFTSSVQIGVVAPVVYREKRTAKDSANVTWAYSWANSGQTLSYSKSSVSGTLTTGTVGFSTAGAVGTYYETNANSTAGGFGAVTSAVASYYREPGAYQSTVIDSTGATTTMAGIRDSYQTAEMSTGQAFVETSLPYVISRSIFGATPDFSTFARNQE